MNTPKSKNYIEATTIPTPRGKVKKVVTFKGIKSNDFAAFLIREKTIKVAGLGIFTLTEKKSYETYLPHTGERKQVRGSMRISFRPTRQIKLTIKNHGK